MVIKKRQAQLTNSSSALSASSSTSAQMKFRPSSQIESKRGTKGTKPLPQPESVPEIFTRVILFGCKRILFIQAKYRLLFYAVFLFLVSLIGDYFPFPRTYFSNTNNIPNQYFVKLSWAWTLIFTSAFVYLTSSVTCCGNRKLMTKHFSRLIIATLIWYIWTTLFSFIEESTGHCIFTKNATSTSGKDTVLVYSKTKKVCRTGGGKWTSFDVSGHSFLLMWCVFFITEECKAILGWETIPNMIINEEYKRKNEYSNGVTSSGESSIIDTPISHLDPEEFETLKVYYKKYNIWAKVLLIILTGFTLLWDIMLMATACYFHVMIEKVIAGLIAVMVWYFTYKGFYKMDTLSLSPGLPGGNTSFKYNTSFTPSASSSSSKSTYYGSFPASTTFWSSSSSSSVATSSRQRPPNRDFTDVPKFMGMPLNPLMKNTRNIGETLEGI